MCGTAAVISPVGEIDNKVYGADETVIFPAGQIEIGPVMKKLRETLTGIQSGAVEDKHNWVFKICERVLQQRLPAAPPTLRWGRFFVRARVASPRSVSNTRGY